MLNIILAAITKNGIKKDEKWQKNENGARPHFFTFFYCACYTNGACPHFCFYFVGFVPK
jgi:hypothetical protein